MWKPLALISALLVMLLSLVPFKAPPFVAPGMAQTAGAVVTIRDTETESVPVALRIPCSVPPAWLPAWCASR